MTGAAVMEYVFTWPGIGKMAVNAALVRDMLVFVRFAIGTLAAMRSRAIDRIIGRPIESPFALTAMLGASLPFPADYGFIPRARSGDGDLLDIFVLGGGQTAPGTVVRARPVGLLEMADDAGSDAKIIGIASTNVPLRAIVEISDLPDRIREEIEAFLHAYKRQNGQHLTVKGWYGRKEA